MRGACICRRAMRRPLPVPMAVPVVLALALALASCAACTGGSRPAPDYPDTTEIDAFFDALQAPEAERAGNDNAAPADVRGRHRSVPSRALAG